MLYVFNYLDFEKSVCLKLPRRSIDRLDLNWYGVAVHVGCQQIKCGNISSEWGGDVSKPPELCCDEMLANLSSQLGIPSGCHSTKPHNGHVNRAAREMLEQSKHWLARLRLHAW